MHGVGASCKDTEQPSLLYLFLFLMHPAGRFFFIRLTRFPMFADLFYPIGYFRMVVICADGNFIEA